MRGILLATLVAGCFESSAPPCAVDCTTDAECPSGLSCNGAKCSVGGEACTAERCEHAGDRRCDGADPNIVQVCDEAGEWSPETTCVATCVSDGAQSARCGVLEPSITVLADVCDTGVDGDRAFGGETLSTDVDSHCTKVLPQAGGPDICLVHAHQITVDAGGALRVIGKRALALVADVDLDVRGIIDVSAEGSSDGPGGGGTRISGTPVNTGHGGGGAGFQTPGGHGGGTTDTAGPMGIDASSSAVLAGGYRAPSNLSSGGAAGGALALISCSGTITVSGVIDAAGGGGVGGRNGAAMDDLGSGSGGGSGGALLLQAGRISLAAASGLFANGGGGGGGSTGAMAGGPGGAGTRSATMGAPGGPSVAMGGIGGVGGFSSGGAGGGAGGSGGESAGGGGGSVGYIVLTTSNPLEMAASAALSPPPQILAAKGR